MGSERVLGGDDANAGGIAGKISEAEPDQFRENAVVIRVLDVGGVALDLATSDPDALREATAAAATRGVRISARAIDRLARELRGPAATLYGFGGAGTAEAAGEALPALAARALGAAVPEGVRPVAGRAPTGPNATAASEGRLRVRFASNTIGLDTRGGEFCMAAEEPVIVAGFAIAESAAGGVARGGLTGAPSRYPGRAAAAAGLSAPRALARAAWAGPVAALKSSPFAGAGSDMKFGTATARRLHRRGITIAALPRGDAAAGTAVATLLRRLRAAVAATGGGAAAAAAAGARYAPPGAARGSRLADALLADRSPGAAAPMGAALEALARLLTAPASDADTPGAAASDLAARGDTPALRAAATGDREFVARWRAARAAAATTHTDATTAAVARRARASGRAAALRAVADTLGIARANAVSHAADAAAVRATLSADERRVVDAATAAAAALSAGDPRCGHRAAARTAARAPAAAAARALKSLEPFLRTVGRGGATPVVDWVGCRRCGAPRAVCGHVVARARLEARGASYVEIRDALAPFASRAVAATGNQIAIFCRVCGAHTADGDAEADPEAAADVELSPLRARVWQTAAAAAARVVFPVPVDEKVFAARAATAAGPVVARLLPSRRAAVDGDLDPLAEVLAVAGAYAYVLEAARAAAAAGRPLGYGAVPPGAPMSKLAGAVLEDLARAASGALAQVEGVTPAWLRDRFSDIYRALGAVSAGGGGADAPRDPAAELAGVVAGSDPIYRWAAAAAALAGDLPPGPPATPAAARRAFETALGDTLPAILARARDALADPELAPLFSARSGADLPAGATLELLYADPRVNFYTGLYEPPQSVAAAAQDFFALAGARGGDSDDLAWAILGATTGGLERTGAMRRHTPDREAKHGPTRPDRAGRDVKPDSQIAPAPAGSAAQFASAPAGSAANAPGAWGDDIAAAALAGEYWAAYAVFADAVKRRGTAAGVAAGERLAIRALRADAALFARNTRPSPRLGPARAPPTRAVRPRAPLGLAFDEQGRRHRWTRYVFDGLAFDGDRAVAAARQAGELDGRGAAEVACADCGIARTAAATGAINEAAVVRAVAAAAEWAAAVEVFAALCPVTASRHEFDAAGACARCGYAPGLRGDPAAAHVFFDRNRAAFTASRRTDRARLPPAPVLPDELPRAAPPARPPTPDPAGLPAFDAATYRFDFAPVVAAAALVGARPAALAALGDAGLLGNRPGEMPVRGFDEVEAGRAPPPPPTELSDPRLAAADAEVRRLLADFGALRRAGARASPPEWAAALLAAAGASGSDIEAALAPAESPGAYEAARAALLASRPPATVLEFATEMFARLALAIAASPRPEAPAWAAPLAAAAARRAVASAVHALRVRTRPGAFNRALLRETVADTPDPNAGDAGDVGEDELDEGILAQEESPDDTGAGFATDDFDAAVDVEKDSEGNFINSKSYD